MQFNPQDERELRGAMLLTPGEYEFEVVKGKDAISKSSGNEMIALTLRVFPNDDGSPRLINDYLVPGSSMGELKINRFCHAVGLQDVYFSGELTGIACDGAAGRCKLTIQVSEEYGDKNTVRDYIVPVADVDEYAQDVPEPPKATKAKSKKKAEPLADDLASAAVADPDIPF